MTDKKQAATLRKTIAPLPVTKRGYGIHIHATSKNGDKVIYTAGRLVIVRNLEDPSQSVVFTEHKAPANVAKFSPNGLWIASGDSEGHVFVWELLTKVIKTRVEICSSILDIDWDSEGKRVVAVGEGSANRARCFMWDSGSALGKIEAHNKPILSVSYRQTRPYRIATSSEDLNVNLYEGPPFKFTKGAQEHTKYPNCVRFSPDGEQYVSVGSDSKIVVWDGKAGTKVKALENKDHGHKGSIFSVSWSPDGKKILTASGDKTAKIWNVEDGSVDKTFTFPDEHDIGAQQVSCYWHKGEKKEYLITISLSGSLNFLNVDAPDKPVTIQGVQAAVTDLKLDHDGKAFYVSSIDGQVTRFDWETGIGKFVGGKGHGKAVKSVGVSGDHLLTVGLDDRLRLNDKKSLKWSSDAVALGGQPTHVAVGKKDSTLVAVSLANSNLVLLHKGVVKGTTSITFVPTFVDFSHDDSELVVGGKDKKVHFFSVSGDGFKHTKEYKDSDKEVLIAHYRPDQSLVATVDKDKRIYFYNKEGKNLNPHGWEYHAATVTSGAWSPSGKRYATGSADESIIVWSDFTKFADDARLQIKDAHTAGVEFLAFWDEDTLVSVGADRSIKVWDLPKSS